MKRAIFILLVVTASLWMLPVGAMVWASHFATVHNCRLNESGSYPCVVNGANWSDTLISASFCGLIGTITTVPLSASAILALTIMAIRKLIQKRSARQLQSNHNE